METMTQDRIFSQVPVLEKEYWADIDNRYRQYRIEMEENAREAEKRKIRRDSLAEGRADGERRMACLNQRLLKEKRYADLDRASTDIGYRHSLYEAYGL